MIRRGGGEDGFTLIEMLVALSVFAIAALALMRLDGFALSTTADLDARGMANLVVRNEAALWATDPGPIVRGTTLGERHERRPRLRRPKDSFADRRSASVRIDLVAHDQGSGARSMLTLVKRVG